MPSNLPATVTPDVIFRIAKMYLSGSEDFPQVTRFPDSWKNITDRLQRTKAILRIFLPETQVDAVARAWIKRATKGSKMTGRDLDETLNGMLQNELDLFYKVQDYLKEQSLSSLGKIQPEEPVKETPKVTMEPLSLSGTPQEDRPKE